MSDFCKQCSIKLFREDMKDLANLGPLEKDYYHVVLCEGCGPTLVDETGSCIGGCSDESHAK